MRRTLGLIAALLLVCLPGMSEAQSCDGCGIGYRPSSVSSSGGTLTGPIVFPNGTIAAPSVTFVGSGSAAGFYYRPDPFYLMCFTSNKLMWCANNSVIAMRNDLILGWTTTTPGDSSIDTSIVRASAGIFTWAATTFAALGTPANGSIAYCSDCTEADPCAGSGTGALAKRLNGRWDCN